MSAPIKEKIQTDGRVSRPNTQKCDVMNASYSHIYYDHEVA